MFYRPTAHCRGTADDIGKRERDVDREVQHRCGVAATRSWHRNGVHNHPFRKLAELKTIFVVEKLVEPLKKIGLEIKEIVKE